MLNRIHHNRFLLFLYFYGYEYVNPILTILNVSFDYPYIRPETDLNYTYYILSLLEFFSSAQEKNSNQISFEFTLNCMDQNPYFIG